METIILNPKTIKDLARKLFVGDLFVQKALDLTEVPPLLVESKATTIREVEEEQTEHENRCNQEERAAFRKWIELATGNMKELLCLFKKIRISEETELERLLAIRAMAEILSKEEAVV